MSRTIWAALAVFGLMTLPAAANCEAELSKLKDAVTAAETGATTAQSGVPATKHQEEVLTGNKAAAGTATTEVFVRRGGRSGFTASERSYGREGRG